MNENDGIERSARTSGGPLRRDLAEIETARHASQKQCPAIIANPPPPVTASAIRALIRASTSWIYRR